MRSPLLPPAMRSIVAVVLLAPAALAAQLPEKFTNLEVFPADVDRSELIGAMRDFTSALGVRCEHCHVGAAGQPLSEFDFAADEREAKRVAREMMRMTRQINSVLLPRTGRRPGELTEVRCATCHHGLPRPRTLADELTAAHAEGGAEAAVERYRQLRETYYGGDSFDFGERALIRVARSLAGDAAAGSDDPVAALLSLNIEHFPESAETHLLLGERLLKGGDREAGRRHLERGLALSPAEPRVRAFVERLLADPPTR